MLLNKVLCAYALALTVLATVVLASPQAERPVFVPCALVNGLLGLPQASVIPCTLMRGARYFRDHYRRGLRMLMKSHRKSMQRNRVINALTNTQNVGEVLKKLASSKSLMY